MRRRAITAGSASRSSPIGAGAFNLVNAVAGAYAERSPVVVIAGAPGARERASGFVLHHQARTVDTQLAVYREITCDQAVLDDRRDGARRDRARAAQRARALAAGLYRVAARHGGGAGRGGAGAAAPAGRSGGARRMRRRDHRPACAGASRRSSSSTSRSAATASKQRVATLARKLRLPVVTTFMGRGLLEDAPDVLRGTYLGAAGDPAITRLVEDADALLLLGVIFSDTNFALSQRKLDPRRTMLAIDRRCTSAITLYPDMPLDDLIEALIARARPRGTAHGAARSAGDAYRARARGRRQADRAVRHRDRDQRPVRPPRRDADDVRHRRLPVHRHGDREHRAGRARLLRRHGLRRAGRHRRRGGDRAAPARSWSATARSR